MLDCGTRKNYYQHILDILIKNGIGYNDMAEAYGFSINAVEAIKRAHRDSARGNLPRGIMPGDFYAFIIENYYCTIEAKIGFSNELCFILESEGIFPERWNANKNQIIGSSDEFDSGMFRSFVIDLLDMDIRNKKAKKSGKRKIVQKTMPELDDKKLFFQTVDESPFDFSSKFFTAGSKRLIDATKEKLFEEISRLSVLFSKIVDVHFLEDDKSFVCANDWLMQLYYLVSQELKKNQSGEILKVEGPLGSYKNRIMQYLYIAIAKNNPEIMPFYIDIESYEKMAEKNESLIEDDFLEAFKNDLETVERIYVSDTQKIPLLILDGVQDFFCRKESLYYSMSELIKNLGFKMIVCIDTDFTINKQQQYKFHPIVSNNYNVYLRIRSMNLNRKADSIEFIKNCIEVFNIEVPNKINAEIIYNSLVHLDFLTIDAYWLVYILNTHLNEIVNKKTDIATLYHSVCAKFLHSSELVDSAAEIAYEFEFGNMNYGDTNPYYDLRWRLIRTHRSVLDYLIAKYCEKELSKLNLKKNDPEQNKSSLSFFSMVLQKSVSRFVVNMLKGNEAFEHQVMIIAENYKELSPNGRSQLVFWLGRLQNKTRRLKAKTLLEKFFKEEMYTYSLDNFKDMAEKRDAAFLLRGICVSLIHEGDKKVLSYYMNSLLTDKVSNSVNRGFHLEYYGDKPYIPNHTLLDYEDDITKGEATLTVLCLSLEKKRKKNKSNSCVAILEIMTICNLIQARMEYREGTVPLDTSPYIEKTKSFLQWIIGVGALKDFPDVCSYFNWMYNELSRFPKYKMPVHYSSDVMNQLIRASDVERTGWKKHNLPRYENIAEHMFDCVVIGILYLPDKCDYEGYCKDDIIKMLLIHDLAETVTGDIRRPDKDLKRQAYEQQEREIMQGILYAGSYPNAVGLNEYLQLWNTWDRRQEINALVAKDIDYIQTMCRFCEYYLDYPDNFVNEDIHYWLGDIDRVITDIGKEIVEILILENPKYASIVRVIME